MRPDVQPVDTRVVSARLCRRLEVHVLDTKLDNIGRLWRLQQGLHLLDAKELSSYLQEILTVRVWGIGLREVW